MKEVELVGVDICQGGWLVLRGFFSPNRRVFLREEAGIFRTLEEVFRLPARIFAIDLPLGLPEDFSPGGRECDLLARKILGPRRGSIFTPPPRKALKYDSYQSLRAAGIKISKQSFNLLPRLREFEKVLKKITPARIFETHPELVFLSLAGYPLPSKHTPLGLETRLKLLEGSGIFRGLALNLAKIPRPFRKDLLDAYACLLAAKRILTGEARKIPENPPCDAVGLPMAIWF